MTDDVEKRRLITENSILRDALRRLRRPARIFVGPKPPHVELKGSEPEKVEAFKALLEDAGVAAEDAAREWLVNQLRELAETHRRFYRLDVLEEAARAVCWRCAIAKDTALGINLDSEVAHWSFDVPLPCAAAPIRRLQLEEWR